MRGWLIIDKPEGISSTHVVRLVKRFFQGMKVGHAGTLDPLASGILPLALGEATKTVSYVMSERKGYTFDLVWGEKRSTDDLEGEILDQSDVRPTPQDIEKALPNFRGKILQKPPLYSALKVQGKRAYDLARRGEMVDLQERPVMIEQFDYLGETPSHNASRFRVFCGKGTYIRSLARDLAESLSTFGYARHIRRFLVGSFEEKNAVSLEKLEMLDKKALIKEHVLSLETVLDDIPALDLSSQEQKKVCLGQAIEVSIERIPHEGRQGSIITCLGPDRFIFALAHLVQGKIKPERLLKI
mgnify:CR=1 FL=1|tara:strand:+ start:93 stop:989 length:897 start_codon:yes stop_codon:yes gene_type:complete